MPKSSITRLEEVGEATLAVEIETPQGFEAFPGQFVLIRATVDGNEESGYYTISSPTVDETFEVTVAVDPDGTLGPWFAGRTLTDSVTVEGPYGEVQYTDDGDVLVLASGPGIGPAVGIAERALDTGHEATVVYGGSNPPHGDRLTRLEKEGATIIISDNLGTAVGSLDFDGVQTYVFGFQGFVEEARTTLTDASVDLDDVEIEGFGPE
ncbi:FAD-dependent oxidoreductase [Halomarina pelagica]|uniref:FAD-dependent oxidoreductase n=1 Tax=Halomarina pelagica TaxID=2961599 RepID=UPI0020C364E2|nr:FAD-dependent oxidoreductase [Halomarina sp. BND7]